VVLIQFLATLLTLSLLQEVVVVVEDKHQEDIMQQMVVLVVEAEVQVRHQVALTQVQEQQVKEIMAVQV
jgi:hypothetical protein